jgi:hypothetical protein
VLVGLLTRAIMDSHYGQTKPAMRVSRESHLSARQTGSIAPSKCLMTTEFIDLTGSRLRNPG